MKRIKIAPGKLLYWFLAVFWLVTTLFPLFFTLISSLKDSKDIFKGFMRLPTDPTLDNFATAIESTGILRAIANSLMVAACTIALMLLVCMMAAYVVSRKRVPGYKVFGGLFVAALMLPVMSLVVPIVQMVNSFNLKGQLWVLCIIYAGINSSLTFFILKNSIDDISPELDEAAMLDGCNLTQIAFRVMMPVIRPSLVTCGILTFINVFNELAIANVLIDNVQSRTLSLALMSLKGDMGAMYGVIFAAVIIALIPTVTLYMFAQEKVEKSIVSGMIKG